MENAFYYNVIFSSKNAFGLGQSGTKMHFIIMNQVMSSLLRQVLRKVLRQVTGAIELYSFFKSMRKNLSKLHFYNTDYKNHGGMASLLGGRE